MNLREQLTGATSREKRAKALSEWLDACCGVAALSSYERLVPLFQQLITELEAVLDDCRDRHQKLKQLEQNVRKVEDLRQRDECLRKIGKLVDAIQPLFRSCPPDTGPCRDNWANV